MSKSTIRGKKIRKVERLNEEIEKVQDAIAEVESEIWSNGETFTSHIKVAVFAELGSYFLNREKEIIKLLAETDLDILEKKCDDILGRIGNQFLLKYGYEELTDNIYQTYLKIDSSEFRFDEDYVDELINLTEDGLQQ